MHPFSILVIILSYSLSFTEIVESVNLFSDLKLHGSEESRPILDGMNSQSEIINFKSFDSGVPQLKLHESDQSLTEDLQGLKDENRSLKDTVSSPRSVDDECDETTIASGLPLRTENHRLRKRRLLADCAVRRKKKSMRSKARRMARKAKENCIIFLLKTMAMFKSQWAKRKLLYIKISKFFRMRWS
ncbi:expressed protein [Phakopsora pachyrhizi]|uniref:Expressed protein n=1 Tax=Phakopsora pachyrhizi TaxID=170000 RepID=A0AAV0BIV6_PHAPC|nr:expressed protein [Phakopsora pachyrhizi]